MLSESEDKINQRIGSKRISVPTDKLIISSDSDTAKSKPTTKNSGLNEDIIKEKKDKIKGQSLKVCF